MRHTCEYCATTYEIPNDKVAGRFLKVRCKMCKETMHVVGITARTNGASCWWVAIGGQPLGPYTDTEVVSMVQLGDVHARSRMWAQGMAGWARVAESEVLGWVYGEIVKRAALDPLLMRQPSTVFDRAALVGDGNGYFPDPTLHSGIIVLDEKTQADLRLMFDRGQKRLAPQGTHAYQPSLLPTIAAAAVGAAAAAAAVVWFALERFV